MGFHHNGERWVSQDKKRIEGYTRNLLTLVRLILNKVLLHESDMDSASSRPARRGRVGLYEPCKPRLVLPFYWQRSLQPCLHGD